MSRQHSIVKHPSNYFYVSLEDDYLFLYDILAKQLDPLKVEQGQPKSASSDCKAMIAAVLEGWMNSKRPNAKNESDLYVHFTIDEWIQQLRYRYKRSVVIQCLHEMEEEGTSTDPQTGKTIKGTIKKRLFVQNTFSYLLNLPVVQSLLDDLPEQSPYDMRPRPALGRPKINGLKMDGISEEESSLKKDGIKINGLKKDSIPEKQSKKRPINAKSSLKKDAPFYTQNSVITQNSNNTKESDSRASSQPTISHPPTGDATHSPVVSLSNEDLLAELARRGILPQSPSSTSGAELSTRSVKNVDNQISRDLSTATIVGEGDARTLGGDVQSLLLEGYRQVGKNGITSLTFEDLVTAQNAALSTHNNDLSDIHAMNDGATTPSPALPESPLNTKEGQDNETVTQGNVQASEQVSCSQRVAIHTELPDMPLPNEKNKNKKPKNVVDFPAGPPLMPPPDAKWDEETAVQIMESKKGRHYSDTTRSQEKGAAKKVLKMIYDDGPITREQFEAATDDMIAWPFWKEHTTVKPMIKTLQKDDKIIAILDDLKKKPVKRPGNGSSAGVAQQKNIYTEMSLDKDLMAKRMEQRQAIIDARKQAQAVAR